MVIVVRHGKTALNEDGSEKTRGWLPVPLTLEGMKEAADVAENLVEVEDVKALYCSDLVRSVQSAHEIARVLSMEVAPREELRDWDLGDYAGQAVKDILDDTRAH